MSREIKFRAWKLDGEMHKPFDLTNLVSDEYAGESWLDCGDGLHIDHRTGWDSLKIMQYTGLKDKNGREIYEGDILKIYYENNQNSYFKEVKWLNDRINKGRWDALDNCVFTSCEVVGNIYENPELITEVKNG